MTYAVVSSCFFLSRETASQRDELIHSPTHGSSLSGGRFVFDEGLSQVGDHRFNVLGRQNRARPRIAPVPYVIVATWVARSGCRSAMPTKLGALAVP